MLALGAEESASRGNLFWYAKKIEANNPVAPLKERTNAQNVII
jgi:hypothetical protein